MIMKTYILTGLTEYAMRHLGTDVYEDLSGMVGCTVYESDQESIVDNGIMIDMPDGEATHIDFLQLEEIMIKGQFTTTYYGEKVEIKEVKPNFAVVYQLDDQSNRIPLFKKEGFLMGRMPLKK